MPYPPIKSELWTKILGFFVYVWSWRCLAMKFGFWKRVDHDFLTHLKRSMDFTGSHDTISTFAPTSTLNSNSTFFLLTTTRVASKSLIPDINNMCPFVLEWKKKIILLFSLFLLLFMSLTALFNTIYKSYGIILTNFYFYLQYF